VPVTSEHAANTMAQITGAIKSSRRMKLVNFCAFTILSTIEMGAQTNFML
jgi:hypothetical protein